MQLPEQCGGRDIALGGEGDATADGMNGLAAHTAMVDMMAVEVCTV